MRVIIFTSNSGSVYKCLMMPNRSLVTECSATMVSEINPTLIRRIGFLSETTSDATTSDATTSDADATTSDADATTSDATTSDADATTSDATTSDATTSDATDLTKPL